MKRATTSLLLGSLASIALAAPRAHDVYTQEGNLDRVGIVAIHSGSDIQYATVNATNSEFWIGKPTTTYCPWDGVENCAQGQNNHLQSVEPNHEQFRMSKETVQNLCPPGNETVIQVSSFGGGLARLDVEVPSGQFIYVEDVGDRKGYLGFQQAPPYNTPPDVLWAGFSIEAGTLYFRGRGFLACPDGEGKGWPYRVLADLDGVKLDNCLKLRAMAVPYKGSTAAYQYI